MTCDCGNKLKTLRVLVATLSNPFQCPACGRFVYVKSPVSESLIVILGVVLVFVSLFLVIKKEWIYLFFSYGAACVLLFAVRFAEVKLAGVRSENNAQFVKSKSLDFFARLVLSVIFVLLMVIAYFIF